jgi:hypothetical protein
MNKFQYSRLNANQQEAYNELARAIRAFETDIQAPSASSEEAFAALNALLFDNPGLCFCDTNKVGIGMAGAGRVKYKLRYETSSPAEADSYRAAMKKAIAAIVGGIPAGATDYDKEKYIHDYFVRNMTYAFPDENLSEWEAFSAVGPLLKQRGVCEGFAKAAVLVLRQAGLTACCVYGKSTFNAQSGLEGHAWNVVEVEGRPYHLDVTWDTTVSTGGAVRYDYFNLPEEDLRRDHSDFAAPPCTDTQGNYFAKNNLYAAGKAGLAALLEQAKSKGTETLTFKVLAGTNGPPPDLEAAKREAMTKAGVRSCEMGFNPVQSIIMLYNLKF